MPNTLQLAGITGGQMLSLHAVASVAAGAALYVPAVFPGRLSLYIILVNSLLLALVEVSDTWILLHSISFK